MHPTRRQLPLEISADEFIDIYKNKVRPIFEGKGVPAFFNSSSEAERKVYMQNNLDRSPGLVKLFDIILPTIYKISNTLDEEEQLDFYINKTKVTFCSYTKFGHLLEESSK